MSETGEGLLVFTPSGIRRPVPDDGSLSVLDAARRFGVDLDSVCGGRGICGRCQIVVAEGSFAKHGLTSRGAHLTPFSEPEERYRERSGLVANRRLGCHAKICGDLVIDIPPESQVHRQVVRKEADAHAIEIDPVVKLHYVAVDAPDMRDPRGDLQRLKDALAREWELDPTGLECDEHVLAALQPALRDGERAVTVAVHERKVITSIWPGFRDVALGVAFDIGSTTVAGHLCDLTSGEVLASAGVMNPQIRFGEDLMSRVSYVMMQPGSEAELTRVIRTCVDGLIGDLVAEAGRERGDILELTVVGNPIMHHLFLGLDPTPLGSAPFPLVTDEAVRQSAADLDLEMAPGARVYVLPCIAGHVGADAAGMVLSEAPHQQDVVNLLVDVGTNAEIVLGNRDRLLAASSPTGPAFEGAQISCGQRAAPGAVERVRIDPDTLEPRFRAIGSETWSDEVGFDPAAVTGVAGSGIIEAIAEMFLAGIVTADGVIDGALGSRSPRIVPDGRTFSYVLHEGEPRLVITQNDVRQIQLAKAALWAGCRLLMDHLGIDRVDRIRLTGAFGAHIDPVHALVLGLIPDCDPAGVTTAGNAAGTGARIALLNLGSRTEIEEVVRRIEKIETATEPRFQEHFVAAMGIPNTVDPFDRLGGVVALPAPKTQHTRTRRRSRHA